MITIKHQKDKFVLSFPYNTEDLDIVKNLPVRTWDKNNRVWEVPQLAVKTLDLLKNVIWTEEAKVQKDKIDRILLTLVDYKFIDKLTYFNDTLLRDYQRVGAEFLKKAKKALLSDEMGLGKSIQAITAAVELNLNSVLILCPATLKYNWFNEFKKHYNIEPIVINGTKEKREELWKIPSKFVIANYELLLVDRNIMPKKWDIIIADECVYLKNSSSERSKLARKLKSEYRFGLSGYYIENNLMELHSIMQWIRPEVLPSAYQFKYRYCMIDFNGKIVGYKNIEEINQLTSPFILKRTKEKVLKELPPKIISEINLEFDSKSSQIYKNIAEEFLSSLQKGDKTITIKNALDKTIKLRQFVEFPEILGFNKCTNPKLDYLEQVYEDVGKIVVFSYFKESVDILRKYFNTKFYITSDVENKKRISVVEEFNDAKKGMIVCTDAGRFGINLTGASTLMHFGYYYNPATLAQREDRTHRMGQKDVVQILRPRYTNSIDVGILNIVKERNDFIKSFIESDINMATAKLSINNFRSIIFGIN